MAFLAVCRDRNLRGARVIRLHILALVFILIHIAAIGAEVGIIGSLNWTRGHRILRGNEGGGIRRRDSQAHVVLLSSGPRGSVAPTAVAGCGGRADREATQAAEGRNSPLS